MSVAYDGGASARTERDRLSLLLEITNLLVSKKTVTELSLALSESIDRLIPHEYASLSLYDTPDELAVPGGVVRDWARGECEPVPGKTMPKFVVVERDYGAVAAKI